MAHGPGTPSTVSDPHPVAESQRGGDDPLSQVVDYLAFVAHSHPLSTLLDVAPAKVAGCVGAEVASIYLLEGDGRTMVLRGNVGFPKGACGRVRLRVGDGPIGRAVGRQRPEATTASDPHDGPLASMGIEPQRIGAAAAAPLLDAKAPLGALVVRRGLDRPFSELELCLVAAVAAPIASAIRLARLLDELRDQPRRPTGAGTRKVILPGVPAVAGRALGAVAALRRPATAPRATPAEDDSERLQRAFETAERALADLAARAHHQQLDEHAHFVDGFALMVGDQQLRRRALASVERGEGLAKALGEVARHAARAAAGSHDSFLVARARDIEQLCDALLMMAAPHSSAVLPAKAVIVAPRLSIYDLLVSAHSQPVGVVVTETVEDEQTRVLLRLLGLPAVTGVHSALRWVEPGDIALLDADHGLLIVNPSRADIAAFRAERRRG